MLLIFSRYVAELDITANDDVIEWCGRDVIDSV